MCSHSYNDQIYNYHMGAVEYKGTIFDSESCRSIKNRQWKYRSTLVELHSSNVMYINVPAASEKNSSGFIPKQFKSHQERKRRLFSLIILTHCF